MGDVDFHEACKIARWITPVPSGVGPMTVAILRPTFLFRSEQSKKWYCPSI